MADLKSGANPLFLREEELRQGMELLFFAYRDFTAEPDLILARHRFGRAHHRVIYFVGRYPGIAVSELLDILGITKQSLSRVLKELESAGFVEIREAPTDRRKRLLALTKEGETLERALTDEEGGYGKRKVRVDEEAMAHLVRIAGGDARIALNALELAVESTPPDGQGFVHVDLKVAEDSIQRRALLYDKDGDAHYDTISAFIKSLRGSDPDAALYWLAKMIYAGEDPRFIVRRMIIFASEDVGLADPQALTVATSAAQALEWVGLPEAQYNLAEAAIYLATAPKSNSAGAYFKALADVEKEGKVEVPDHLKDATRDGQALGHGKGYKYPHDYPGHHMRQQYLPDELQGRRYYEPGELGYEREIAKRLKRFREQADPDENEG